jgi:hypothetical protein
MSTTTSHGSYAEVERRHVTDEERAWINDIVSSNPHWADVQLGDLFVVAECNCGCRSVALETPEHIQNPKFIGHQGLVGEIDLSIRFNGRDDIVSVLLHYAEGSLSLLEVVWYNFPEPVPRKWTELGRDLRVGD